MSDLTAACAQGRAFAEAEKLTFFAASAKTGDGVQEMFEHLISTLPIEGTASGSGGGGGGSAASSGSGKAPVVQVTAQVPRQQQGSSECGC